MHLYIYSLTSAVCTLILTTLKWIACTLLIWLYPLSQNIMFSIITNVQIFHFKYISVRYLRISPCMHFNQFDFIILLKSSCVKILTCLHFIVWIQVLLANTSENLSNDDWGIWFRRHISPGWRRRNSWRKGWNKDIGQILNRWPLPFQPLCSSFCSL